MTVSVGDRGRAVTPLKPGGKVAVGDATYDARSEHGFVEAGRECVVVRGDLTGLVVRAVDPGAKASPVENHGEPVSVGRERIATTADTDADERHAAQVRRADRHRVAAGLIAAGSLGGMVGLAAAGLGPLLGWVPATDPAALAALLAGGLGAGVAWSLVLFYLLGTIYRRAAGAPFAPSFVALSVALVGTAVGAWWGAASGWPAVIGLGLAGALVGGGVGLLVRWFVGGITRE